MQAPSPLSRFAIFFLLGSLVFVLVMLHILERLPDVPKGRGSQHVYPQVKPTP